MPSWTYVVKKEYQHPHSLLSPSLLAYIPQTSGKEVSAVRWLISTQYCAPANPTIHISRVHGKLLILRRPPSSCLGSAAKSSTSFVSQSLMLDRHIKVVASHCNRALSACLLAPSHGVFVAVHFLLQLYSLGKILLEQFGPLPQLLKHPLVRPSVYSEIQGWSKGTVPP